MERMIKASELERFCVQQFFTGAVSPENLVEHRRHNRLFDALKLDEVAYKLDSLSKEDRTKPLAETFPGGLAPFPISDDVLEYFLKATNTKIPGAWVRPILRISERMIAAKDKPASNAVAPAAAVPPPAE